MTEDRLSEIEIFVSTAKIDSQNITMVSYLIECVLELKKLKKNFNRVIDRMVENDV